jgi:hypothetical protein
MAELPKPSDLLKSKLPRPQDVLKKKDLQQGSGSTSQPFAGGLTPSQSFQVSTEQPAVLTPKGEQRYKVSRAKEQEQLNTAIQAYKANNTPEDNLSVERASQISARNQLQSAISKDVDNEGNLGGYLYNKVLQGAGSAVSGLIDLGIVGFQGLKNPNPAALISSIPETQETLKDYRTNYAPQIKNFLRENIGANVDLGKEREFDEGFVTGAIGGLAYSAPAMVTPYGVGMFTQAYDSGLNAISSTPEGKNLSEAEKTLFAGATGLIIGGLEKAGLDKIVGKSRANVSNRILLGALDSIVEAGEKVTSEGLEKAVNQQIKTISRSLPQIVRGATQSSGTGAKVEALTEFTQELGTVGLERLTNYIKDKEIFDEQSVGETFGRLLKSLGQGAIGGGLLGGIVGGVQTLAPNVDAELTARIVNAQTQQDLDTVVKDIEDIAVENGYAEEQAQLLSERVSKLVELNSKLPSDFTPEERAVVIPAIEERDAITEEINTKTKSLENIDEAFRVEEEAKIQALENRRQELNQQIANPEVIQLNINQDAVKEGNIEQGGEQQREGVVSQEQGQQEDRGNQEEPISQSQTTPSSGNSTIESEQEQVNPALRDVESTARALSLDMMSGEDLQLIYENLSQSSNPDIRVISSLVENLQEQKERKSILDTSLDKVKDVVDAILKQDDYFLEKREAREAKEVADKYLGNVTKQDAIKDFKDAFFGNPESWVSDSLKMRESVRVYMEQGGTFKELLSKVQKEFESDGFTESDAANVIKSKLESINKEDFRKEQVAEAYHQAKKDGSNPELVQAVEELITTDNINDTTRQGETTEVNRTVTESLPVGETVETADTTDVQEDVISDSTFWQDLTESDKRATRIKTIEDRLSKFKSSRSNLSIAQDPKEQAKYMRDLTELAILKIADGTVKTAKAFSNMVKGYGFTQDNIDKAYNAAVESAKKYSETNPDQLSINEREGELVVNFQQPKETQATTKVGVGKVKELTEGGITGRVTITNKQALKSQIQTLNRGIREGIKQQKEKGNKEANVLSEAKKKVSDWIESFKQTDYFKGKSIPNSVVTRLASRALAVKNVNQLYRLTEYMEKVFENVEFFNSVEKVNSLKTKVKALSKKIKKRKASKELAESLNELTLIDPTYLSLEDVKLYESVLDNASKLFTSPVADLYDGIATRLEESSTKAKEQYQALKEIRVTANQLRDSYKASKIKSLVAQLDESGIDEKILENLLKDKTLDEAIEGLAKQLEVKLDEAGNPSEVKPSQREILSNIYEYLRGDVESNLDEYKEYLTKEESELLDMLLSLGANELSDTNLFQAVASLRNLSINGSVEGLGKIAARAQLINNLKDKTKVANFNEGFRQSSKIGRMLRSNFTSGTTYLRSLLRNEKYAGKVLGLLGISQFQESSAKAFRKIEATVKEVEDLFKKYKTLADPYKISEITILADLVSYREGWTDEEIQENFQKQKDQLKQTIEGEEAQSKLDDEYAEANKDSIKDLKDIYESIKDLTLEEAQKRLDNLDSGAKELYDLVRAKFDEIKEQAMFVSKQFGGNSFEKGWVNYIPRGFKNLGSNDIEKIRNIEEAKDGFFGSTLKEAASAEASGLKSRVGGMRKGYVRDYNFVTNFFRTYNELVYNIETKADINYMLEALDSEEIQSNTKARGQYLRGLTDLMLRKINNDKTAALFGSSENLYRKLINAYSDLAVAQALGGIGQIVKQGVPVIADTIFRTLDKPFLVVKAIGDYAQNADKIKDFMKVSNVSMRNQSNAVIPTFNPNRLKNIIRRTVGLKGVELERLTDNFSKISMTSLTLGDQWSATVSWLTFYSKYMLEEEGVTDIDYDSKPNSDAVAYANLMVNTLANESDSSLKSEITRTQTFKSVFMLMSFAINSMEDLASNIARLRHSQTYNKKDLASITKNISANLVQVASFHYIASIIRDLAIQGYGEVSELLFGLGADDEEEKKLYEDTIAYTVKEAREMNKIRSKVFWLDDFLFRGLGKAVVGDAFDDVTTSVGNYLGIISDEEKFKLDNKKPYQKSDFENLVKILGILAIPAQNAVSIYKVASDIMSEDVDNEKFLKNRFAQEAASGTGIFIPEEDKNKKLDDELKMVALTNLTVGVLNFIIPFQEVGGINRRLTSLNRKVREIKFGKKQDKEENLKLLKSLSTFKIGDRDIVLTPEQLDFALKTREDLYNKYYQEDKAFYVRNKISEKDFEKEIGSNLNKATRDAVLMKYAEKDLADKSKIDFETKKKELDFIVEKFIESKTK